MIRYVLIAAILWINPATADITAAELLGKCEQNNLVVERVEGTAKVVGEELDSYCKGYIEGHISAMTGKICLTGRDTHFVVSLLKRYMTETPAAANQPAGDVLSKSILRAYACK